MMNPPLIIMELAMPVSLTPTLSCLRVLLGLQPLTTTAYLLRVQRERGQTNRFASFTLMEVA